MKLIRSAAFAAMMVVTLAGVALASTGLHQTPPLSASDYLACGDTQPVEGKVLWHFVLTQTQADEGMLTVTFGYPLYDKSVLSSKNSGGVLHFNVLSDIGDVVVAATSTADGDQLNLSHTCYAEAPSSEPSTTPSEAPSSTPSVEPSATPSVAPSDEPTATPSPTTSPTASPSETPVSTPSQTPPGCQCTQPPPTVTMPPTDTAGATDARSTDGTPILFLIAGLGTLAYLVIWKTKRPYRR